MKGPGRLAIPLCLALILAGCGPLPHPSSDVADFQGLFPTLTAHHVTYFSYVDRGCQAIAYERGTFLTDLSDGVCTQMFVGDVSNARPFDATARADFDAIEQAAVELGFSLYEALPVFGADGSIIGGQFKLDDLYDLLLRPWLVVLPDTCALGRTPARATLRSTPIGTSGSARTSDLPPRGDTAVPRWAQRGSGAPTSIRRTLGTPIPIPGCRRALVHLGRAVTASWGRWR